MRAVIVSSLQKYEVGVKKVPIPTPQPGSLLVRVEVVPINQSDQHFMKGTYNQFATPQAPYIVGFEGAGVVVDVGEGVDKKKWLNKKISFGTNTGGTWAEYISFPESYPFKMVMSDKVNLLDIASSVINPMTVMAMYDLAMKAGVTAIANNVGASSLGRQLVRLSQKKGFDVVNVVRRQAQVDELQAMGAKYIVNMSKEGWQQEFHDLTDELGATLLFDAIGGDVASEFLAQMPSESTLYNYGRISGNPLSGFASDSFIFQGKKVAGLDLPQWVGSLKPLEREGYIGSVIQDFTNGGAVFGSKVAKIFDLEQFKEAVEYANAHTLEGKVYLIPGVWKEEMVKMSKEKAISPRL